MTRLQLICLLLLDAGELSKDDLGRPRSRYRAAAEELERLGLVRWDGVFPELTEAGQWALDAACAVV